MVLVLVLLVAAAASSHATVSRDITTIYASPQVDEKSRTVLPAYPSVFVHLGDDERRLPSFSKPDGTPIAIRGVVEISSSLQRVDLDIGEGEIVVRLDHGDIPVASFTIDPMFRPRTRSVEVRPTGTLRVDSDAVAFHVFAPGRDEVVFNEGRIFLELDTQQRVIALYSDGSEAVIFDGVPRQPVDLGRLVPHFRLTSTDLSPLPATVLLLLVLGAIGLLAARTTD